MPVAFPSTIRSAALWMSRNRKKIFLRTAVLVVILLVLGAYLFVKPSTWRCYTDESGLTRAARDVGPGFVAWDRPVPLPGMQGLQGVAPLAAISPDGGTMAFSAETKKGNRDLFLSSWNGIRWGAPRPMRALNSAFNETSPAFSRDGRVLYFSTDRPGSLGNYDIWAARWDGAEYAWPLPLSHMVNSAFDELGPKPSATDDRLYFSSNKPNRPMTRKEADMSAAELRENMSAFDHDIFVADMIPSGVTNREVERATSMLYYLRESALADPDVMARLGGTARSERAVSKALAWLAKTQEKDGHWNMQAYGGARQHDVGATALALLAFLGRGQRHDIHCKYRDTVTRAIEWLVTKQNPIDGDLRGRGGNMYDHGIAALALAEAYGVTKHPDLVLPAQIAIEYIVLHQNAKTGGWRYSPTSNDSDMSVSGWQIMALKSAQLSGLRVPQETFEGARQWLDHVSGGEHGGIYGYQNGGGRQPAMIATGYFCCQLMGLSPNTFRAFETAEFLGRGMARLQDGYFCYYATLSSYQNQGRLWRRWQERIQKELPDTQSREGYWQPQGRHANQMGQVVCTALMALSLQAHYRYTPLYGLGFEPKEEPVVSEVMGDSLPAMPLYRRARRLEVVNSPEDELQPCVTAFGDFLYFSSDRSGGYGGLDLYRARITGEEPAEPQNLGPVVNTGSDETGPLLRMHGFNLIYGSGSDGPSLRSSVSRRVFRERQRKTFPPLRYLKLMWKRLFALALIVLLMVILTVRGVKAGRRN